MLMVVTYYYNHIFCLLISFKYSTLTRRDLKEDDSRPYLNHKKSDVWYWIIKTIVKKNDFESPLTSILQTVSDQLILMCISYSHQMCSCTNTLWMIDLECDADSNGSVLCIKSLRIYEALNCKFSHLKPYNPSLIN